MRAVLDVNVLVSAVLSRSGAPAQLLVRWLEGDFELVISAQLLEELQRALAYPKLRSRIGAEEAVRFVNLLRDGARLAPDPTAVPKRSPDPGDDYLLALAEVELATVVSGDRHLLGLAGKLPVCTARAFLDQLVPED